MAQTFTTVASTDSLTSSRQKLLDRDDAAASNFSGTAFPSTGLLVGMTCYRTDQNKLYVLKDTTPTWIEISDAAGASGLSPRATILATSRTFSITGDATATGIGFDGSNNVTLSLTLGNSGVTAGTYTKVTVDAKGRVTVGATLANSDLPASGVTAGTYTKVTVNDRGVVTSATTLVSGDLPTSPTLSGTLTVPTERLTNTGAIGLATDTHAWQIGPTAGINLTANQNEIQVRNNGAAGALSINPLGGNVTIGSAGATTTVLGTFSATLATDAVVTSNITNLAVTTAKIADGAVTALKMADGAGVADQVNATAGGVGSYAWATRTTGTTDVAFGTTLAGSSLSPTSAARIVGPGLGGNNAASFTVGTALSGTWRCMGTYDHTFTSTTDGSGNSQTIGGSTLWLRIS